MKLLIGVPTAGNPAAPFLQSLQNLQLVSAVTGLENKTIIGNFVPAQRELLAAYALHRGADFLMMVDDDMIVPPDAIGRLLEPFTDEKTAIVGALCYSRDGIRPMAVEHWDPADTTGAAIPAFAEGPVTVGGVGFGLAIVRCSAFATLTQPYFPTQVFIEQAAGRVRVCNEDFLFCHRLRAAGWNVVLHAGVKCGHYDRATQQVMPLQWEPTDDTNHRRMLARNGEGQIVKLPFDAGTGRTQERHLRAELEYVIVD